MPRAVPSELTERFVRCSSPSLFYSLPMCSGCCFDREALTKIGGAKLMSFTFI